MPRGEYSPNVSAVFRSACMYGCQSQVRNVVICCDSRSWWPCCCFWNHLKFNRRLQETDQGFCNVVLNHLNSFEIFVERAAAHPSVEAKTDWILSFVLFELHLSFCAVASFRGLHLQSMSLSKSVAGVHGDVKFWTFETNIHLVSPSSSRINWAATQSIC